MDQIAALFSVILSLVGTGASLFIWMAVSGWTDKAGVGAAVLFIVLSALQVNLSDMAVIKCLDMHIQNANFFHIV